MILGSLAYKILHEPVHFFSRDCPFFTGLLGSYTPLVWWWSKHKKKQGCADRFLLTYPLVEALTMLLFWWLITNISFGTACFYILFFSGLLISLITDLHYLLIPHLILRVLAGLGLLGASLGFLPITMLESLLGMIFGYGILWCVRTIAYKMLKEEGLGLGDLDLLLFIGAFLGPLGSWISLAGGALLGSLIGITLRSLLGPKHRVLPFGPFLIAFALFYTVKPATLVAIFFPAL